VPFKYFRFDSPQSTLQRENDIFIINPLWSAFSKSLIFINKNAVSVGGGQKGRKKRF